MVALQHVFKCWFYPISLGQHSYCLYAVIHQIKYILLLPNICCFKFRFWLKLVSIILLSSSSTLFTFYTTTALLCCWVYNLQDKSCLKQDGGLLTSLILCHYLVVWLVRQGVVILSYYLQRMCIIFSCCFVNPFLSVVRVLEDLQNKILNT